MGRELIRRAIVALQHAADAKTVEYQVRHADEARRAFEQALRSARARFDAAERKPTGASRTIARRAVHFELEELIEIEAQLEAIEARVAERIAGLCDPRDHRRFRLAE